MRLHLACLLRKGRQSRTMGLHGASSRNQKEHRARPDWDSPLSYRIPLRYVAPFRQKPNDLRGRWDLFGEEKRSGVREALTDLGRSAGVI